MATKKDNLQIYVTDIAGTIRSVEGSTEKINAQDFSDRIRAIGEAGGVGGKTTPSFTSGRANKIIISRRNENSSFYPRWVETVSNAYLFTNNSIINVDTGTWSFGSPTVLINAEQEGVDDVGDLIAAHIKDTEDDLIVFYKANNLTEPTSYSIIGKILQNNAFIPNVTRIIEGTGSLHQPFVFGNYVYYTEESEDGTRRDIKRVRINYTISGGVVQTFDLDAPENVISGENNVNDDGTTYLSAHLGSPVIARLTDGNLIIVYDSDVNKDLGYPYTIQYSYSTDDGATWEEGRTLFKITGYNNKAPYIVVDPFGKVAISYHANNEYIENSYGADTIFDYVFKAFISSGTIYCGDTLTPADFVEIPISRNQADEWTGAYGSLAIINGEVTPVYAHGPYDDNQGTIIDTVEVSSAKVKQIEESLGLVVYAHENRTEKTITAKVEAISDSIVRRNSLGFVYGSTATNLDPTNEPTILTTKAYVANFGKANYLPLKGGIISGSLVIQGDLTIAGTVTTEKTETLAVKDSVIVTNADGAVLGATLSGIAIRKDGENTYGIMYDPSNDSVKLGLGTLDAKNKFTFNESGTDGKPIATRDDSSKFTNGNLVKWERTSKSLVDSGKKVGDFVEKTTVANIAYTTNNNGDANTTHISFNPTKWDLVTFDGFACLRTSDPTGDDGRQCVNKQTADKTYVKQVTKGGGMWAYIIDGNDNQDVLGIDDGSSAWSLARRGANGVLKVGTPVSDNDATTKKYVEDGFVAKQIPLATRSAYTTAANGEQSLMIIHGGSAEPYSIASRSAGGVLRVGTPVGVNDATTKQYVDNFNTITITAGA